MLKQIRRKLIVMALTFLVRVIFYPDGVFGTGLVKVVADLPNVVVEVE